MSRLQLSFGDFTRLEQMLTSPEPYQFGWPLGLVESGLATLIGKLCITEDGKKYIKNHKKPEFPTLRKKIFMNDNHETLECKEGSD